MSREENRRSVQVRSKSTGFAGSPVLLTIRGLLVLIGTDNAAPAHFPLLVTALIGDLLARHYRPIAGASRVACLRQHGNKYVYLTIAAIISADIPHADICKYHGTFIYSEYVVDHTEASAHLSQMQCSGCFRNDRQKLPYSLSSI